MAGGRGPSSHFCCVLGFIVVIVLQLAHEQNAEQTPLTSRKRPQLHPSSRSQTFRIHFDGYLHLSPSWCPAGAAEAAAGRKRANGPRTSIISVAQSAMMQEMRVVPMEVTLEPPSPHPTSTNEQEQVEAYCNQRPSDDMLHDFALLRLSWIPPPDDAEGEGVEHQHGEGEQSDNDDTTATVVAAKQLQQTALIVHDALMTCFSLSSIAPSEDHPANSACQHPSPGGGPSALRAFYDGPFLTIRAIVPDAQITVPTTTTTRRKRRRASPPPSMAGDDGTARLPSSRRIATSGRKLLQNEAGNNDNDDDNNVASPQSVLPVHPVDILRMEELWASFPNAMGQGVHVAMLDSGLSVNNPHFTSMSHQQSVVASCLTFTDEELPRGQQASAYCGDGVGHGTFTASVVAGQGEMVATSGVGAARGTSSGGCRSSSFSRVTNNSSIAKGRNRGGPKLINGVGIAPKVNLHIFKVFTDSQLSLTSWVLAALNVAMQMHIDIINLSFGGMDYYDDVFVEKIRDVTNAGTTVVTASGNDGPRQGSVFNPADQAEVVAVGSVAVVVETQGEKQQQQLQSLEKYNRAISGFSSRGMTTWELPFGIGRPRPDILGYGDKIVAASNLRAKRTCRVSSGTSMASPVVAGVLAVLTSALKALQPSQILPLDARGRTRANVALLKQIIVATADPVPLRKGLRFAIKDLRDVSVFSQGAGTINATRALTYIWAEATSPSSEMHLPGTLVGVGGVDRLLRLTAYPSRIIAVSAWVSRGRSPHRPNLWSEFLNEELFVDDDAQRYPFQLKDPSTRQQWRLHRDMDAPYIWPNMLRSGGIFLTSTPLLQNMTLYSSGAAHATFGSSHVEFDANASVAFTAVTAQQQQSPTTTILSKEAASALLEVIVEPHRPSLDAHVGYVTIGFWTAVPLPVRMLGARIRGTVWLSYSSLLKSGSGGGTSGEKSSRTTAVWRVGIPFVIDVTQPPPRSERLLWDTTTQLLYPSALIPRDNVREQNQFSDFAEWGGDHPHTNYVQLYEHLVVRRGFVVDLVHHRNFYEPSSLADKKIHVVKKPTHKEDGETTSCPKDDAALTVDLYQYLLVVDPEDFFEPSFLSAVECGVKDRGLRLLLASDWAHEGVMKLTSFVDPATNFYHEAVVGGTNVGSVNALLTKFGFVQSDHCVISGPLRGGVDGGSFLAMVTSGGCIATTTTTLQPPSSTSLQTTPSGSNLAVDSIGCSIDAREMHNDAAELRNAVGPNGKGNKRMMRNTPSVLWSSHADDSFGGALPLSLVLRRFCPPGHRYDGTIASAVANKKKRASIAIINDDGDAATSSPAIAGGPVTSSEDGEGRSNCGGVFFIADSDCLDGMHHYLPGGAPSSHTYCMSLLDAAMDALSSNTEFLDSATAGVLSGPQCGRLSFAEATTNAKKKMLMLNQSESEFHDSGHLFYTSRRYRSFHTTFQGKDSNHEHVVNATHQYRRKCGPPQRSTRNKQQQHQQSSSSAVVASPIRCPVERWEVEDSVARMLQSWLDHLRREQQQQSDIPVEKKNSHRQHHARFQGSGGTSIFRRFLMLGLAVAILLFLWRKWLCALPGKRLRSSAVRRASSFV
ncbi:subtilisin-like serine protease, putative [Bodo saltans]|uniref:Subtilisin-like serine protease, putative n=1 Tax=Bodo saltans TaxID=75058 RepID=A0A0S4JJQ8_BODSA|nr:subtilisin-like serine protease, putative [Bodo saltans]|eukprot:CUG91774.1 subtilisin-like serine protease, putative [Bodo saltans]